MGAVRGSLTQFHVDLSSRRDVQPSLSSMGTADMRIGGDTTGVVHTQKGPQPGREDASFNVGLLWPLEIPAARKDRELACFLRRATGPRFLAVYISVLVLVILVLAACIAVLKSSQCPDPQGHAPDVASRAENPQAPATGVASSAENAKNSEVLPPCGDGWIWFRNKCYFFSEVDANWDAAKQACASWNSSLAVIDNQREMDFVMRYKGERDHWIGLRRDSDQPWKWVNGTEFDNWPAAATTKRGQSSLETPSW
ncbi:uncharacterized protein [Ambystoma mexicanum]|uniref:uncharacterized protein isoform X2 n=1 Tax=Ambystoma mexicanum TaxID=8296 RepID=UPI0037E70EBA